MYRLLLCILFCVTNSLIAESMVYVATSSPPALEVLKLNESKGELKKVKSIPLSDSPDVMACSKDKKFIYVGLRTKAKLTDKIRGIFITLEIGEDGIPVKSSTFKSNIQARFMTPDHTGNYLLVTDYFAGKSAVLKLNDGVISKEVLSQIETEKLSHSIVISKDNKYAYAPHTGPNKVYQFKFDEKTGVLSSNGSSQSPPKDDKRYFAPRHASWHPNLPVLYTSNEHSGGISTWKINSDGSLQLAQTLSSLPEDYEGNSTAADVHVTPNGKFVYVSNRGKKGATSKSGINTLACFKIDQKTGHLIEAGHFSTTVRPRSFCISESGKYIIVAGQTSNELALHVVKLDGSLSQPKITSIKARLNWVLSISK